MAEEVIDLTEDVPIVVVEDNASQADIVSKVGAGKRAVVLHAHQVKAMQGIQNKSGLLAVHRTGSGKTMLGLAARLQLQRYWKPEILAAGRENVYAVVVCPLKVKQQYESEIARLKLKARVFKFFTYDDLRKGPQFAEALEWLIQNPFNILIFDEAHTLSNMESQVTQAAIRLSTKARFVLCTTATPIVNSQADLAPLLLLVSAQKTIVPLDKKAFNEMYKIDEKGKLENRDKLEKAMQGLVSVYMHFTPEQQMRFPTPFFETRHVAMSKEQLDLYMAAEAREFKGKKVQDLAKLTDAFYSTTRQLCNTVKHLNPELTDAQASPKLVAVAEYIAAHPKPAVVYSSFVANGIETIRPLLAAKNLRIGTISGATPDTLSVVQAYNSGEYDVLLLSPAGGAGIDLKKTRQLHILEQPFTDADLQQAIGRGIRDGSHLELRVEQRNVTVIQWIATKHETEDYFQIFGGAAAKKKRAGRKTPTKRKSKTPRKKSASKPKAKRKSKTPKKTRAKSAFKPKAKKKTPQGSKSAAKKTPSKPRGKKTPASPKAVKEKIVQEQRGATDFPTADQILQRFNMQKREVTEVFMQVMRCASIERQLGDRDAQLKCKEPIDPNVVRLRGVLKIQDLLEVFA